MRITAQKCCAVLVLRGTLASYMTFYTIPFKFSLYEDNLPSQTVGLSSLHVKKPRKFKISQLCCYFPPSLRKSKKWSKDVANTLLPHKKKSRKQELYVVKSSRYAHRARIPSPLPLRVAKTGRN